MYERVQVSIYMTQRICNLIYRVAAVQPDPRPAVLIEAIGASDGKKGLTRHTHTRAYAEKKNA